jgi:hypothetical protein
MTNIIEIRGFGGNILQLLFKDIAHNFMTEDEETKRMLEVCFDVEDAFLAEEEIEDDFVVGICSPLP